MNRLAACLLLFLVAVTSAAVADEPSSDATPTPAVRVALAGDSTVCDYAESSPSRGWGMMLKEFFAPNTIEVHNFAKSGRSTKTFIAEGHWKKLLASQPDYVFIQFGHNDSHDPKNPEATDAATDYREYLRQYVSEAREIGATPLLVTPMVRRRFLDDGTLDDNLLPYAEAMKAVGKELEVPVIDLHARTWKLVELLGPEKAAQWANRPSDATHFNARGARAMAKLVCQDLAEAAPELAKLLAEDSQK